MDHRKSQTRLPGNPAEPQVKVSAAWNLGDLGRRFGSGNAVVCAILAISLFLLLRPFAVLGVDPHHDGLVFKVAYDIYHGAVPFRDSFTQYGLLLALLDSYLLRIFGLHLLVLRIFTIACYAAAAPVLWLTWKQLIGSRLSLFGVVLWIALSGFWLQTLLPWASATALPFQAGAILCMISYATSRSLGASFWAAALAAVVFWIRMPVGTLMIICQVAVVGYLALLDGSLIQRPGHLMRGVAAALGGIALVSIPLFGYLVINNDLYDWYAQTFRMAAVFAQNIPFAWMGSDSLTMSLLMSLFPADLGFIWVVAPVACIAVATLCVLRHILSPASRRDPELQTAFVAAAFALASWPQYYPVTEERHVFWSAMPMIGIALYAGRILFAQLVSRLPRIGALRWIDRPGIPTLASAATALLICAVPIAKRAEAAAERLSEYRYVIDTPEVLAGLRVTAEDRDLYAVMSRDITQLEKEFPSAPIVNAGYDALYLTFGDYRPNWHPLFVYFDIGVAIYPDFPTELGRILREKQPIVLTTGYVLNDNFHAVALYSNGISLLAPGRTAALTMLRPLHKDAAQLDVSVTNRFNLGSPMRTTGHRLPVVSVGNEATIEFVFRPNLLEGTAAVVFTNLFGPTPFHGFSVRRTLIDHQYRFVIGADRSRLIDLLRFTVTPLECNYVVIRRNKDLWDVWVNGVPVDEAKIADATVATRNQLVINNGYSLLEYHVGLLNELRVLDRVFSPDEIADQNRYTQHRCRSSS